MKSEVISMGLSFPSLMNIPSNSKFLIIGSDLIRNDLNETSNDKDNNESPSIFDAVEWGDKDLVEKLIKSGVDINTTKSGGSILTAVIENGQKEIIKFLLANGANINEDNENKEILFLDLNFDINSIDKNGITPLMLAVDCEQQNPVAFLIGQGADLEITNADNETALEGVSSFQRKSNCNVV